MFDVINCLSSAEIVEPPRAEKRGRRAYLPSMGFMGGGTDPDAQGVGSGSLSSKTILKKIA